MAREWSDDDVRAEIAAAVKIVREDREKAEYQRLHGMYGAPEGQPPVPPEKEPPEPVKKRGIWWGEQLSEGTES